MYIFYFPVLPVVRVGVVPKCSGTSAKTTFLVSLLSDEIILVGVTMNFASTLPTLGHE